MKTIELKNRQIIEEYTSQKEALHFIEMCYLDSKEFLGDDFSLYIQYKDGSEYYLSASGEEGKFRRTGIATVIESNPCTYSVYGDYRLEKMDEDEDDENCTWLVR